MTLISASSFFSRGVERSLDYVGEGRVHERVPAEEPYLS